MPDIPSLPEGYRFHHIGYATHSIEKELKVFEFLGYAREGASFADDTQGVAGCFLTGPGPRVELLENLPGSETLTSWLNAGIRLYHFAYCVEDIDAALGWAKSQRAIVTVQPVPAVAFQGRRICFVMFRNNLLIEFIESADRGT